MLRALRWRLPWRESKVRGNLAGSRRVLRRSTRQHVLHYGGALASSRVSCWKMMILRLRCFVTPAARGRTENTKTAAVVCDSTPMGQMIWDAQFDGHDLTMCNMFRQPKPAGEVVANVWLLCFPFRTIGRMAASSPEDIRCIRRDALRCWRTTPAGVRGRQSARDRALRVCDGVPVIIIRRNLAVVIA